MFLSYNPKFIFVHIPKTAGTSISESLRTVARGKVEQGCQTCSWDHHTTAKQFNNRLHDYDQHFSFSFIRNPWDWMYSWYSFHSQMNNRFGRNIKEHDFKWWLLEYQHVMPNTHLPNEKIIPSQKRCQMDWLTDTDNNIIVNYIGKFETLNNDFEIIKEKLNIKDNLQIKNKSDHGLYKKSYDNEMIEYVYKYSANLIERFNYEF